MNYRERIRKAIECPQFGDETYGEWGALNLEQRKFIKRLLDELDRADNYLKKVYLENIKLKEQLLVAKTNEETFRLEMEDITKTLGLDEDTIFDDVKAYARSLKDNWNKIKQIIENERMSHWAPSPLFLTELLSKMQKLEKSDSNE